MRSARLIAQVVLTGSWAGLAACAGGAQLDRPATKTPTYRGVEVTLMGGDLVRVQASLSGAKGPAPLGDYVMCNAAGYAVKNKAGFVRNVRTLTDKEGGIWRADAVYSITSALPKGLQTIDAQVTVEDCLVRGIPTGD